MKLKPLFDRVVLKKTELKQKNTFGLVLPETSGEKPLVGEVISVGDGVISDSDTRTMIVKKNDRVVFSKYAGTEIKIDNTDYIIIRQSDILAILEKN